MKRKPSSPKQNEAGFTLIEAFVAIIVITVSLMGLAQLMVVSLERFEFAKYDTKAIHVAKSKMEQLRAMYSWQLTTGTANAEIQAGEHGPVLVRPESPSGSSGEPLDFWVTWEVADLPRQQKSIEISVSPPTLNPRLNEIVIVSSLFSP